MADSNTTLSLVKGRIINVVCRPYVVDHMLQNSDGEDMRIFRGDIVTFNVSMSDGIIPKEATKFRIIAKPYKGLGMVGGDTLFAKETNITSESALPLSILFGSEETGAEAGQYLISFIFVNAEDGIVTAAAGILQLIESGNDKHFIPPPAFRDEVFAARDQVLASQANVQEMTAEVKEALIATVDAMNASMQIKADVGALKTATETLTEEARNYTASAQILEERSREHVNHSEDAAQLSTAEAERARREADRANDEANRAVGIQDPNGLLKKLGLTREKRDAMLAPTGGWARIPRSATELLIPLPLSFAITADTSSFNLGTNNDFFSSYLYPGLGIRLAFQSPALIACRYNVAQQQYCQDNFSLSEVPLGMHTFVTTISDERRAGNQYRLTMRLWVDGVERTGSAYAAGIPEDSTISAQADYVIGGGSAYAVSRIAAMVGSYSRAMIFDRLLTEAEVADYNNGNDPVGAIVSLKDVNGSQWRDVSGNGHHATLYNDNTGAKPRDIFVMSDIGIWTAAGTKYFLSSTDKVLPANCRFNLILTANAACTVAVKNGSGVQYASVPLAAGIPYDAGNFINTTDGKLSFTPNISAVTINANLEIRKF